MFCDLVRSRRCIIPMDGFYEWGLDERGKKQAYRVAPRDGGMWGVAGLWDETIRDGTEAAGSFTVLTMAAAPKVARLNQRMPVILRRDDEAAWLSPEVSDVREIERLVQPYPEADLRIYRVSDRVNSTRNDGPELIRPDAKPMAPKQAELWELP